MQWDVTTCDKSIHPSNLLEQILVQITKMEYTSSLLQYSSNLNDFLSTSLYITVPTIFFSFEHRRIEEWTVHGAYINFCKIFTQKVTIDK